MLSFRKTYTVQTTDQYVSDLTRRLRRSLPRDKAEQIAGESHAHLSDRVDELVGRGVAQHEAESVAVAGFGMVKQYAHVAVLHAYGDRNSVRWRLVGQLAVVSFSFFLTISMNLPFTQARSPEGVSAIIIAAAKGSLLLIPLAAFWSRLPQTRTLLTLMTIAALCGGIATSLWHIPNAGTPAFLFAGLSSSSRPLYDGPGLPRADYRKMIASKRRDARILLEETALLKQGVSVYRASRPVPPNLMSEGRFIVPKPVADYWKIAVTSVFKEPQSLMGSVTENEAQLRLLPYVTMATRQEAERVWSERGQWWLDTKLGHVAFHDADVITLKGAATAPLGFNSGAATHFASLLLWLCVPLIMLDYLMAHLGRALWIAARNFRRKQSA